MQYLEIETPEGTRRVPLTRDRLTIGRRADNDVPLQHAQVSRQHAELLNVAGEWWIRDLGSTNGLHVGEHRVHRHQLSSGDQVWLTPDVAIRFIGDDMGQAGSIAPWPSPAQPETTPDASPWPATPLPPGGPSPAAPWWNQTPPADAARPTQGPAWPQGAPPHGPLVAGGGAQDHYRRTMPVQRSPITAIILYTCQTCGQRTAPDVELCQACHQSIARPCTTCHASLLPVQERCPRCQTPNPASIHHANRRPMT
jgi:hypothetical protein